VGRGTKIHKNPLKLDPKISLVIIENLSNAVIEYVF